MVVVATANLCIVASGLRNRHMVALVFVPTAVVPLVALATLWAYSNVLAASVALFLALSGFVYATHLGRLIGGVIGLLAKCFGVEWDERKNERLKMFAAEHLASPGEAASLERPDVICVQELVSGALGAGAYPEVLAAHAEAKGYTCVLPPAMPQWPSVTMNSLLCMLSRLPVLEVHFAVFKTQVFNEKFGVNRGAMAIIVDTQPDTQEQSASEPEPQDIRDRYLLIVNCHIAPTGSVAGPLAVFTGECNRRGRAAMLDELPELINKWRQFRGQQLRVVLAGDFNANVKFTGGRPAWAVNGGTPDAASLRSFKRIQRAMARADLRNAHEVRLRTKGDEAPQRFLRPTFGYKAAPPVAEAVATAALADATRNAEAAALLKRRLEAYKLYHITSLTETRLTSTANMDCETCDDLVFISGGLAVEAVGEVPLLAPLPAHAKAPETDMSPLLQQAQRGDVITHLSDHWMVSVMLGRQ